MLSKPLPRLLPSLALLLPLALALATSCQSNTPETDTAASGSQPAGAAPDSAGTKFLSKPLIKDIYTADPSAHVFDGKIYIYPSHDIEAGMPENDNGDHFAMRDYHVLSMDSIGGKVTDHGVALDIKDVAWAGRQMWAPDAAFKNDTYYLYFPAKDKQDVFRIGVATSTSPTGPFKAQPQPIEGSMSIDPAIFTDTNGGSYLYVGGIWGGQLQRWRTGQYDASNPKEQEPADNEVAPGPRVARMSSDMLRFAEPMKEVKILDQDGKPLLAGDKSRRFFEGAWVHKHNGTYYLSYSTGDTHLLVYATSTSPYGPFTYQGIIMNPVQGWTTHHSIIEQQGKWYIFYHDTELSGKTWLRNIKVAELPRNADGSFGTITP
ncbi:glycoside hydrolase family 43 protein [Hymenobacter psychrotolerans]|uniref:Glycosyl hydrolases family 43 n=1 Tax=Hymenobacter psychrotolerans DSM 18569 TaxID=1121959 RepID=A0A1M6XYN6_9BACT|nr:glycoside hydrolase family 43 protein [Hymenobacter psychrotolerans]SHL10989.1 Glycosyl hydrolases family 43 [Hymenobacter psychrotolerans DSM 18569]